MQKTSLNCFHCHYAIDKLKYWGWLPCTVLKKRVRCGSICRLFVNRESFTQLLLS